METLDAEHLRSVAALWRATRRELRTSFQGSSMRPTIEPGEPVILRCTDSVAPGDVVAVASGRDVLVHRLVAMSHDRWWLLRGDANNFCDVPITDRESIIGRIESVERNGRLLGLDAPPRPRLFARVTTAIVHQLLGVNVTLGVAAARLLIEMRRLLIGVLSRRPNPS